MSKYIPVKVSHKRQKQLINEGAWCIFWRMDESEQYWVKAATFHGARIMATYGLSAI